MMSPTEPSYLCALVSVCVCVLHVQSQDNLWELVLSYHVGLRNWIQVVRLGGKCLSPLSHLSSSTSQSDIYGSVGDRTRSTVYISKSSAAELHPSSSSWLLLSHWCKTEKHSNLFFNPTHLNLCEGWIREADDSSASVSQESGKRLENLFQSKKPMLQVSGCLRSVLQLFLGLDFV